MNLRPFPLQSRLFHGTNDMVVEDYELVASSREQGTPPEVNE